MKRIYYVVFINLIVLHFCGAGFAQTVFRGKVLDEASKAPIDNVKVGISDQGIGIITNSKGAFNYRKYHQTIGKASVLKITAPGYESIELVGDQIRNLFNKTSTFYLQKSETQLNTKTFTDQKNIAVFWDASLSSKRRNFKKEWSFITSYFAELDEVNISFIVFNESMLSRKSFVIDKDISALKKAVEDIEYGGATSYDILTTGNADVALLFSDGEAVLGEWKANRSTPVYAVSSISRANHNYLRSMASYTSGSYINLSNSSVAESIEQIKSGIPFKDKTIAISKQFKGVVATTTGPIQGASITIKGDLEEFLSRADGSFVVPAEEGDVLQVRYLGMYPREMLVEGDGPLTIDMKPLDELLDEVVLEGRKAREASDKADVGYGDKDKDAIGFAVSTITSADIRPNATYLSDIIRGRFAGVQVSGFGDDAQFTIRGGNNSQPAVWVLDGSLYTEVPNFVNPQNIESISIIKSSIAAIRYGSVASGGAFIVRTKSFVEFDDRGEIVDRALVKGNDYTDQVESLNLEVLKPDYIKQIQKLESIDKQYEMYQNLSKANTTNASFFADMAIYFQPLDKDKAAQIRSRLVEVAQKNAKVLRIVAYLYESARDYTNALKLYERIASLAPQDAQSYRDLAKAYEEAGFYDKSLELYINMLAEQIIGVDFSGLERPLGHELLHLVSLHRDQIDYERLPEEWLINDYRLDLRMVLEWSDREVPFEFQFVNPQKKYFKWNHTLFDNKERLQEELKSGFQTEEFVIDEAPHGLWIVNIEYLGENTYTKIPPYLKYTIYRDYGTSEERKDVKVIKLTSEIGKAQLDEFLL